MNPRAYLRNLWSAVIGRPDRRSIAAAAENHRLLADWIASKLTPDDQMRWTAEALRDRSRDLERNNPLARQFLRMVAVNVIGPHGMRLQSKIKNNDGNLNKLFNSRIEEAWEEWCEQPTRDGRGDFSSFSRLLIKQVARDGEVFVRIWRGFDRNRFGLALEPLPAELIDSEINIAKGTDRNEIRLGVEVDDDGRAVNFHGWNMPARLIMPGAGRQRIVYPGDQIIHLYDPEHVNQTRGWPWMIASMVSLKMLDGYEEAELIAARIGAAKMGFYQRRENSDMAALGKGTGTKGAFTMEANPGTFGIVPDGYELAEWAADHPSTAFEPFTKTATRKIASGLGVSYNALANDLVGVNYSSMRSGLILERDWWRTLQSFWISAFQRRVYAEFLNAAILNGALVLDTRDFRKVNRAKWTPRGWASVDPNKETTAARDGIGAGLESRTDILAAQGRDFEDVIAKLAEENAIAEQEGVDIAIVNAAAAANPADAGDDDEDGDDDGAADGKKPSKNGKAAGKDRGLWSPARRRVLK